MHQSLNLSKTILLRKTSILFLFGLLFFQCKLTGQVKPYSFTHYGVKNGLAAYNTRSIVQDETGFIWIGTINGLQRFDGTRFVTFRHNPSDTNSLPDNYVEQLLIDKYKNLWLVLNDGSIGIFDTKLFKFRKASVQPGNETNLQALRKLQQDYEGNLFYTFQNIEVLTYNRDRNIFSASNNFFSLPPNWKAVNLTEDPVTKKYWIGTDSGMVVFNSLSKKTSYYGHNTEQEPFIEKLGKIKGITCYGIDKKRRIWLISWPVNVGAGRFYCYDLKNNITVLDEFDLVMVVKKYMEPDFFMEQKDGTIWFSGLNTFVKFMEADKSFRVINSSIGGEQSIYYERAQLFEDREQNIWVATSNNGIYVFNPSHQLFTSIPHQNRINGEIGGGYLLSFAPAANGTTLVGVWGDGIYRYDSLFQNIPLGINGIPEVNGLPVWDMCRQKKTGIVWMVGQPGFIYLYNEQTNIAKRYDPPIFEGRTIRQVAEDKQGNIWLGSQSRGVIKWMQSKAIQKFEDGFYKINDIPNLRVYNITIDSKGFVWACTNKEGVYKIDPVTDRIMEHLTRNGPGHKKLLNNEASTIFEYNDSIMIIAAGGLNIYNTRTQTIRYLTSADGLPSDVVMSIEKDKSGYLWLGLMNGLCRMNLAKNTFTFFDRSDGIANDNFQVSASGSLPDGRMLFGSSDDFVVFNPNEIKTATPPPDAFITDIRLPARPLLVDSVLKLKRLELPPNQNSITISFAGLSYLNKSKPVYFYLMEGIDKEWKKANELNQSVYNYLPPGNYTFKIRTENADGIPGKNITELFIRVKPPFWKTWWFFSLLAFAAIGIIYLLDKFRVSRIRETERVRTRIATSLTRDMSTTLSNINLASELAKVKVDKDIERTKEYISQISESSSRMMEVMDDMIWSIDPGNDELQYTIRRMKKYAATIQSRYNLEVSFAIEEKVNEIKLNMDKRHELFLIFKEALLNTGKHAGSKFADVDISYESGKIKLKLVDDGKGFDINEVSFGRGLTDMRKKAESIQASFEIMSEINTGTTVVLLMEA